MVSVCNLAVLSSHKGDRELHISYFNALTGLGCLLGPLIGCLLYFLGGYTAPFYGIALIYSACLLYFRHKLASEETAHKSDTITDDINSSLIGEPKLKVSLCALLSILRCLFSLYIQFQANFMMSFNTPLVNTHLDFLEYRPRFLGLNLSLTALTYAMAIPVSHYMCLKF